MITSKSIGYTGRLANQIMQHAVLIAIATKKGYEVKLPAKNEAVKPDGCFNCTNGTWMPYSLDLYNCFDLSAKKCSDKELEEVKNQYGEKGFGFDPGVFNVEDWTSVDGYFQSWKYFKDARNEILKEFAFKPHIEKEANDVIAKINDREIVSVHIRRGDYVASPTFAPVGAEYISNALSRFDDKDYNFLIVSDDIPWCKSVFEGDENVFFSEGHSHYVDLCILCKCQHSIIANSSFSWWGAWANQNPNKKVIAPKEWFKPDKQLDSKEMYCDNWIVL